MKKLLAFIFLASIMLFSECKKYPEGPAISLISKKERIANEWRLSKYLEDDIDKTSDFNNIFTKFEFNTTKAGEYTINRQYFSVVSTTEMGKWSFSGDKEDLILQPAYINTGTLPEKSSWQILKLKEDELWIRNFDSNGKKTEYHLKP